MYKGAVLHLGSKMGPKLGELLKPSTKIPCCLAAYGFAVCRARASALLLSSVASVEIVDRVLREEPGETLGRDLCGVVVKIMAPFGVP